MLKTTIDSLRKEKAKLWARVARDLSRSNRQRREINLSRIQRFAKDGDVVVVPGKVLSAGILLKKVNVAAWSFSATAKEKIKASGGKTFSLQELVKSNPKGTGVKIIG